jgi:mycofactocin system creatininase family protein
MTAGPLRLADATWPDLEARPRGVLIVPLGATEQHGPHLPLDTDTYLASEIASRVNAIRPASGLAPPIAFGSSGEHADFAGTLSIGTDVLRDVVVELVRDSSRHWSSLLVVNGHGGNIDALQLAAEVCRHEGRTFAAVHLAVEGMDAHAGAAETSMMLYLNPDRVRLPLMQQGHISSTRELMQQLREDGVRTVSANGVLGDPTNASADEGLRWIDALTAKAIAAHDLLAASA